MSSDVDSVIIKQGSMRRYSTSKKRWVDKYYVLYSNTPQRLDWYDSSKAYKNDPTIRMTLFIEEILQIDRFSAAKNTNSNGFVSKKYMLKLQTYRSPEKADILAATSENDLNEWILTINQLVEAARVRSREIRTDSNLERRIADDCYQPKDHAAISFDVEVDDTAASNLCELNDHYKLVLSSHHMTLVNQSDVPVLTWEYCNIRRYGYGTERFTVEGGHKAGAAQGLFLFKSCDGVGMSKAYETKMLEYRRLKEQDLDRESYAYIDVVHGNAGGDGAALKPAESITYPNDTFSSTTTNEPVMKSKPSTAKKPPKVITPSAPLSGLSINSVSRTNSDSSGGPSSANTIQSATSAPVHSRSSSKSSNDDGSNISGAPPPLPPLPPPPTAVDPSSSSRPQFKNPVIAKFSHFIGHIKQTKTPKAPGERRRGASETIENLSEDQYDELDLSSAPGLRPKPLTNSTLVGNSEGYDPTHLYGPIEMSGRGQSVVVESEYAELRT